MVVYPVILAGGSGTRLWPLSRERYPKQFLPLVSGRTLFQDTLCRLDSMEGVEAPVVVCNEVHRFLVTEQMAQMGKKPLAVIVEPVGRNTAPALTLAMLTLAGMSETQGSDPLVLSMHADHLVRNVKAFQAAVRRGMEPAQSGYLVTFGVVPDSPETGYGYIRKGGPIEGPPGQGDSGLEPGDAMSPAIKPHRLSAFTEKPDDETARAYVQSNDYLWNSGIFMMRTSVWMSQLERHRPDIAEGCRKAHARVRVDGDFHRPGVEEFTACPGESIDYAVMEKAAGQPGNQALSSKQAVLPQTAMGCAVVPLEAGWSDVGAWSSLWEEREQDQDGNVTQGDVYAGSTKNALLLAHYRLLAAVGLTDVVVVETADAVLVAHKDHVQDVKEVVERLKKDGRIEQADHRKVHRPWGTYETIDSGQGFNVKRISVNPGSALSLQKHRHRAEHWVVVEGTARVTRGDQVLLLEENQSIYVPKGTKHRLENPGSGPLEIIEVQTGSYLGEDDIVRFDDNYGRHRETQAGSSRGSIASRRV